MRPASNKRRDLLEGYGRVCDAIKAFAGDHCARCSRLLESPCDFHHPYLRGRGREAWKTLCVIPLCRSCHDWVHENPNAAREDGWLIKARKTL